MLKLVSLFLSLICVPAFAAPVLTVAELLESFQRVAPAVRESVALEGINRVHQLAALDQSLAPLIIADLRLARGALENLLEREKREQSSLPGWDSTPWIVRLDDFSTKYLTALMLARMEVAVLWPDVPVVRFDFDFLQGKKTPRPKLALARETVFVEARKDILSLLEHAQKKQSLLLFFFAVDRRKCADYLLRK